MHNFVQFKNVSLKYKNSSKEILKELNFEINEGEMVAIVGPSGVGKSTLFKAIVKSLKPTIGTIKVFDQDISKIKRTKWNQIMDKIGFLSQKPNLIISDNAYNNIKRSVTQYKNWFFKLINFLTKKQKTNIFTTLNELGILDKAFYRISDLSGGQQQRVEIAKLLVKNCKLILADEPTSSLDHSTSREVLTLLKELQNSLKATILVNIHDLSLVPEFFDKVMVINNQKIEYFGNTNKIEVEKLIHLIEK